MKSCTMICDLQFGSTGKGLIAGYLAERDEPDTLITAWMPNAGHTYVDSNGKKYVHTMLANGIVSPKARKIMIAPGSAINVDNLAKEVEECLNLFARNDIRIIIHENTAVVQDRHREAESSSMTAIGSTKKGCGAALAEKIARQPDVYCTVGQIRDNVCLSALFDRITKLGVEVRVVNTHSWLHELYMANHVQVEGAQGFSLGMNSSFYPYCTSRECTPAQIASDCLLSIRDINCVVGCMRTYPIRVANRYDEQGNMIGWSGPCYADQEETTFEAINQQVEHTTVTKLPRRIFTFSQIQTAQALSICRPDEVFLNFINYLEPGETEKMIETIDGLNCSRVVRYLGHGPSRYEVDDLADHGQWFGGK